MNERVEIQRDDKASANGSLEDVNGNKASDERIEAFTPEETSRLTRMDSLHNPTLADYWRDDADDDLIANP